MYKIALLPGDGIGPEIIPQAVRVLQAVGEKYNRQFALQTALIGGAAYDATGHPLPEETLAVCRNSDAVLLGAVGGPKWDNLAPELRPERGALLPLRKKLGLYANLRPAVVNPALATASTLKEDIVAGLDILIIRELTGGLYFGQKHRQDLPGGGQKAVETLEYTTHEVARVARLGFEMARRRRKKLTSVDKANVLESSRLWREVVESLAGEYPDVELSHMYVDNCAMQLVRNPKQFDVLITENMFGDILTDLASQLTGSIGMLPSASLGGEVALYEPIHGSAPDIAGQNLANPIATILSAAMMLRISFGLEDEAAAVERAVNKVLQQGYRTGDIMQPGKTRLGTVEMTDAVISALGQDA
ncbi:3-isopropylmalate dehydrogenase [Desulforamulus hydrothermalis]|uniref:3-isopropylmalate dehydrogenase n=1 Tax=Desulforamulus hydrothermalis Lam5 = DSM 18033 TaxID=1121428 RepID=K8DYE7_9FIRM|nr:3-isopropylmalate dehydrogenase [Desulforamulus hydrothermalis]CCO07857.1 putative tartrate dehydrogenase [Desulforamulus hydrothermalis Lam5 = DSM 18033]SHH27820.1 3-isopropylmalate dehydrogenase [Desulforamulus hydrothermalis Lam5 = DSM 18033]